MPRKMTITSDDDLYQGLERRVGLQIMAADRLRMRIGRQIFDRTK